MMGRTFGLVATYPWHAAAGMFALGLTVPIVAPDSARTLTILALGGAVLVARFLSPRPATASAAVVAIGMLALATGVEVGETRLAAVDAPAARIDDGADLSGRGYLLTHPRPSPLGSSAELGVTSGPLRGVHLLARLPRWAADLTQQPIGAELRVRGELRSLGTIAREDRSREFQVAAWLRRRRLAGEVRVDAVSPTGRRRGGIGGLLDRMRSRAEVAVTAGLRDDRAALLRGMVLGQDEEISQPVRDEFRAAGLSHILAVSGQNVMLLSALAAPLLMAAGLGVGGRALALLALIALYVPLAGAGLSLQRAAIMGTAGIASMLAARPASRAYALLLAAVVTLTLNPRACTDPGWQLSCAAVAGILVLGRRLSAAMREGLRALALGAGAHGGHVPAARDGLASRRVATIADDASAAIDSAGRRVLPALSDGIAITVAATVATAPLLAHHFGVVSLAALPANVLALPAVAPAMWLGMAKAAVGQVSAIGLSPQPVANVLGTLAAVPLALIATLAERFATIPAAQARLELRSPVSVAIAYVVIAAALLAVRSAMPPLIARVGEAGSLWRRLPAARRAAIVALATALAALAAAQSLAPPRPVEALTVRFLDVGQGDATLIQHPDGTAMLFDGGPPEGDVSRLLRRAGVRRLALVVATHMSRDHQGGLHSVLASFPVGLLLDGGDGTRDRDFQALEAEADRHGIRRVIALAPMRLRVGPFDLDLLSPPPRPPGPPPDDANPRGVTVIVSAEGFDLLLSADAESPTLTNLPLADVDAMKVPHHGSSDPGLPDVLRRLRPEIAGIEVGRQNSYGHPASSTLTALRRAGVRTYRTDQDGTVTLTVEHGAMRVATER